MVLNSSAYASNVAIKNVNHNASELTNGTLSTELLPNPTVLSVLQVDSPIVTVSITTLQGTSLTNNSVGTEYVSSDVIVGNTGTVTDITVGSTLFNSDNTSKNLTSTGTGMTYTSNTAGASNGVTLNDGQGRITVLKSPGQGNGIVGTSTGHPFDIISAGNVHIHMNEFGPTSGAMMTLGLGSNIDVSATGTTLNTALTVYSTSTTPDGTEGRLFYNTTHKSLSFFNGTSWVTIGSNN